MRGDGVNKQRRYFLIGATSVVGGLGVVGAAVPFVKSWNPSAKARALGAPVTVDFSRLNPGEMLGPIPAWRGQPVFILYRTPAALEMLPKLDASRADPTSERDQQPAYARNEWRSRRPEIGVYVGICTHLGCSPKYFPVVTPEPFDASWQGGFFCPCHGSMFDLAGRVAKGVPAPANLVVPPYEFVSDKVVTIGIDEEHA
jgi:ubiquinol-cytochrome c reductase iron-sulfur subunit